MFFLVHTRLKYLMEFRLGNLYLQEHPLLSKSERKKICRLMDCKKLSMDACMHAAQNDRLPLRVVVQVRTSIGFSISGE